MLKEVSQGAKNCELVKKYNVSKSTTSTILKNKEKITSSAADSTNRKHLQKVTYADVEDALLKWFTDARACNIPISWLMMLGKARNFAFLLDRPGFCPGKGWLHLFKTEVTAACVWNCFCKASFIDAVPDAEPDASKDDRSGGDLWQRVVDSEMGG
nr:uncharacterized protein LOC129383462 [Dermacentor andersoni]